MKGKKLRILKSSTCYIGTLTKINMNDNLYNKKKIRDKKDIHGNNAIHNTYSKSNHVIKSHATQSYANKPHVAKNYITNLSSKNNFNEGIRLIKVLMEYGFGSRRACDAMIAKSMVSINKKVATLGDRVFKNDKISVTVMRDKKDHTLSKQYKLIYLDDWFERMQSKNENTQIILYNKPCGEIVTRSDPDNRVSVFDKLPLIRRNKQFVSVGRLDFNTAGLLIFTNNGRLANRLMHPSYGVEREYLVRIFSDRPIDKEIIDQLTSTDGIKLSTGGMNIKFEKLYAIHANKNNDHNGVYNEDYNILLPYINDNNLQNTSWHLDDNAQSNTTGMISKTNYWYRLIIKDGRNRVIRKTFEDLGICVSRLIRIRFGNISMPLKMKQGSFYTCNCNETKNILSHFQLL